MYAKNFRLRGGESIGVVAGGNAYIDLGLLYDQGISISWVNLLGTVEAKWQFRVSKKGETTGTDGTTDPLTNDFFLVSSANASMAVDWLQNGVWVGHNRKLSAGEKLWVKVTNLSVIDTGDFYVTAAVGRGANNFGTE